MYERLIFASEIERQATRMLIRDVFPHAIMIDLPDGICSDYIFDLNLDIEKCVFFRWAIGTQPDGCVPLYFCYGMSMELFDPPPWMANELRRLLKS